MFYLFKVEFLRTYLGFNVIQHAVTLTPGYMETKWWFYIPNLIKQIPWLVPMGVGGGLFILYGRIKRNSKFNPSTKLRTGIQNAKLQFQNTTPRESKPTLGVRVEPQGEISARTDRYRILFLLVWLFLPLMVLRCRLCHLW
jgi:hypothetical protein